MKIIIMTSLLLFFTSVIATPIYIAPVYTAPKAPEKTHSLGKHNDIRQDDYYWLNDRKNPAVINYLNAENMYTQQKMNHTKKLQTTLYQEMKSRIKEDDSTYPLKNGPYFYYTRFEKGQQYPIFARKNKIDSKNEEILFNVNRLAKGHNYYSANYLISPNHQLAAYSYDKIGRRFYNIKFKNLVTGQFYKNEILSVTGEIAWANDNKTVFYVRQDRDTLRSYQVYKYNIDTGKSDLVYEEKQDIFSVGIESSLTKKYIYINIYSTLSNEVRLINADLPHQEPLLLFQRQPAHEFSVADDDEYFYIQSNKNAKNYQILRTPQSKPNLEKAEIWLGHRETTFIDDFIVLKKHLVIASHKNGLTQIEVIDKQTKKQTELNFSDAAYSVRLSENIEYDTTHLRYIYTSLRSPMSVYDYNFSTAQSELRKTKEVPGFNADNYKSERIFAKARDGRMVPISLLMKKEVLLDGKNPVLIYGYGSYGATMDPRFNSTVLSLVDRGYIYALAHIRGGGEMGRYWTDEGRTLNKKNTFYDFIDCTEFLIEKKYAHPKKVFAMGGSAGGLLMGVIANLRPDLYRGIIAQVPFVDVLTTMLDDTIPLTTSEYDEWGNPNDKKYYDYIKSYSPYDNVTPQNYPHMLVTTGLHDSQVQYWEPAKWIARLRKLNTSQNTILLKTDMSAGHGGKSGRFDKIKDDAFEYAFILNMEKP